MGITLRLCAGDLVRVLLSIVIARVALMHSDVGLKTLTLHLDVFYARSNFRSVIREGITGFCVGSATRTYQGAHMSNSLEQIAWLHSILLYAPVRDFAAIVVLKRVITAS